MNEFMLLIRNDISQHEHMTPDQEHEFLQKCKEYIAALTKEGKLKAAQPLVREGAMVSGTKGTWKEGPFTEHAEVIVGYYHILAKDLREAISIAQRNPEFEFSTTARVEVRPIKTAEKMTGYVYPK